MNILIVSSDYPDRKRSVYTFVKQLVDQFALLGNDCCVIAPYSITKNRSICKPYEMDGNVHILRPNYISFSNWKIAGIHPSSYFRKKALNKALKRLPFKPDIIYAHFWHCGLEIYNYAKSNCIPLFVATGESIIPKSVINPNFRDFYEYVRGVICVSTKNKEESINNGMTTADKCLVAPNAINPAKFHILDKTKCRMDLNIAHDAFVVAFCGAFIHRKGVKVLSDAIDSIDGKDVFSLFLGRPLEELPSCKNVLFQGPVPHDYLIKYLNAADIFVLPTLHEGCCNAIIEAMACGLPVISSNRPFNWDVLNSSNSILIDPEDYSQVAKAIALLRDDNTKRERLAAGAIESTKSLTIEERAKRILQFIQTKYSN